MESSFLKKLLIEAYENNVSDVHIVPGHSPLFRKNTILMPTDYAIVTPAEAEEYLRSIIDERQYNRFLENRDLDFSTQVDEICRFRVNAHFQRNSVAMAFRVISENVPTPAELNLPLVVESFVDLPRGLVLVTGQTGSGKSTTLASLIGEMNQRYNYHIITLEDPIEYKIRSNKCTIEQREIGSDVPNFASGLKHTLRQDPDVILVGEMRDLETTSSAITAAETGHLVLSTLHTNSAAQSIERIIDIYPTYEQNQARTMLANTLQAVVSMVLFKRSDTDGMVPACEIMLCNAAIRNLIRENAIHEIPNVIQTNRTLGMMMLDDSIKELYLNNRISYEQAISQAQNPNALRMAIGA